MGMEMNKNYEKLVDAAKKARMNAYAPYSGMSVGAAILTEKGVFVGTNVENASYGLSICAERTAVFTAVTAGARQVLAIAIAGGNPEPLPPCGACRQVLAEFNPKMPCVLAGSSDKTIEFRLDELLAHPFLSDHLEK